MTQTFTRSPMDLKLFCFLSGLCLLAGFPAHGLYNLIEVTASIDESAGGIDFAWDSSEAPAPMMTISRRVQGESGALSWNQQILLPRATTTWTDGDVAPGIIYEYKFFMAADEENENPDATAAYVSCGYQIPLVDDRGTVLVVVDDTVAGDLSQEIQRFEMDLAGDGWTVQRLDFARDGVGTVEGLRSEIQARHGVEPLSSIVLLGRLPILESGWIRPDEHEYYVQATDLIYADVDGDWQDVLDLQEEEFSYYPGDGHYDNGVVPGPNGEIEIPIGRIDLSGMTAWPQGESELLRRYLEKNHNFRHLHYTVPREGYFTSLAFDGSPVEAAAVSAMLGPENCYEIYDNGEFEQANPLLWGIAARDWNGDNYPGYRFKSHFTVNFASGKQAWQWDNNAMRAMLAMPWYGLTCAWGVRPNWFFHHMGLGETVGYSTLRTVNNNDNSIPSGGLDYEPVDEVSDVDFPEGLDGYVHLNLMGDPTLRMHPVAPVRDLVATVAGGNVNLVWGPSADPGVSGYHVYRALEARGPYLRLTNIPQTGLSYEYSGGISGESWFMIRPVKLESVPMGSYWNAGQGIFARVTDGVANTLPVADDQAVSTQPGIPIAITATGSGADGNGIVFTVATDASHGEVTGSAPDFIYTPEAGFEGVDSFRFHVWDGVSQRTGTITIGVDGDGGGNMNPMPDYASWQAGIDWQGRDSSPTGNPDGDQLSNWWEFHQGHDPLDGTSAHFTALQLVEVEGGRYFEFGYQRRKFSSGLVLEIAPGGLLPWDAVSETNLTVLEDVTGGDEFVEQVRVRLPLGQEGAEEGFFRLSISP